MKYSFKKKLEIALTLDSSEAVMFNQGGRHDVLLEKKYDADDEIESSFPDLNQFDEVKISVQMDRKEQARFTHVHEEAKKHRAQWDAINAAEKKPFKPDSSAPSPSASLRRDDSQPNCS